MTGIDGGTAAQIQDLTRSLDAPLPDPWAADEAEFFVEWQVPDGARHQLEERKASTMRSTWSL